jgi:hypothetical protein
MAAKRKGPGKGRGPATRPASPAKRTTVPKPTAAKGPPGGTAQASGKPAQASGKPAQASGKPAQASGKPAQASGKPAQASGKSATPASASATPVSAQPAPANSAPAPAPSATPAPAPAKSAASTNRAPASGKATPSTPPAKGAKGAPTAKAAPAAAKTASPPAKPSGSAAGKAARTKASGAPAAPAAPATAKGRPRGGPTREERLAAAEAERRRRSIRNKALLAIGVVAVMFVVSFVLVSDRRERDQQASEFQTGSCQFDRKTDGDDGQGRNHVPTPTYEVDPPAGGNHTPQAAGPGLYTEANAPVDGQIVHAMEHGYVVLWYRPGLDEQSLNSFRELAQKHQPNVLLVPRPSLDTPVAATAWHARLLCGAVDVDTVERFITTYLNQGPEKGFITDTGPAQ